jgi:hypothetical protein
MNFWTSCGFDQLHRNAHGWLEPSEDYFRLYLARPELALVSESCKAEIRLHQSLLASPLLPVEPQVLSQLKDPDVRDNYRVFLGFRDSLLACGTLENYCLALFRNGVTHTPPDFIDLMVQAIVRNLLDASTDARLARAAEMLFRAQRISVQNGQVLSADLKVVDMHSQTGGLGELGKLLLENKVALKAQNLEVLQDDNAHRYWLADERFNFLLDLTHEVQQELSHGLTLRMNRARSGLTSLAQVLEMWLAHLLGVRVNISPLQRIEDPSWRWHVGLDAQASTLLNDLYEDRPVDEARMARLVSLFRLEFLDVGDMRPDVAGKPVYLAMMMNEQNILRLKPQNLLLNLPLKAAS